MEADESSQPLKYKTWVLKVYIHCEACKKKVKKVLQSVDGVFTTTVDSVQQKVTVTGDVDADTLIKKLQKTGKYVELWPQKEDKSGKKGSGKGGDAGGKNGKGPAEKKNEAGGKKSGGGDEAKDGAAKEASGEKPGDGDAKKQGTDEKPAGEAASPDGGKAKEGNGGGNGGSGGSGKKKGKKGNGNGNGGGGGGGGENSGDGSAGNGGDQPPAAVGAPAAVAQVGGATVASAPHLQLIHQYPPCVPPVCGGWGGQWTPAVNYSTATPVLSYGGSYTLPPYVDASFMVPHSSGGVMRYVPPGSYLQRQDDYNMYDEENASVCSPRSPSRQDADDAERRRATPAKHRGSGDTRSLPPKGRARLFEETATSDAASPVAPDQGESGRGLPARAGRGALKMAQRGRKWCQWSQASRRR
ncbi:Heavy metal-associated isoprenylated plant protein 26 [Nymphaea thermarum]|nr:Heavy metal-associated isoprenylated plant protein 26 [Nymphaea thermarum]